MKVFISWSGNISSIVANALNENIPYILHNLKPWFSPNALNKGSVFFNEIINQLSVHDIGIFCITPDNLNSPWLHFEAGAIFKSIEKSRNYLLLIGLKPEEIKGPLSNFNMTLFKYDDCLKLFNDINNRMGSEKVEKNILENSFKVAWKRITLEVKKYNLDFNSTSDLLYQLTKGNKALYDPENIIFVENGYDTHELVKQVLTSCKKKLYIFGRKNRKMLDKEYMFFYDDLGSRLKKGFDFKCLFLDNDAPTKIIRCAHRDSDFNMQLTDCIQKAKKILHEHSIDPSLVARKYSSHRNTAMYIIDNYILYTNIECSSSNGIEALTNKSYYICLATSIKGKMLINQFNMVWNNSIPL